MLHTHGVAGPSPVVPTNKKPPRTQSFGGFLFFAKTSSIHPCVPDQPQGFAASAPLPQHQQIQEVKYF